MSKHYYRLFIDTPTGKRLSDYWHRCIRCEREAEKYAKKMGGEFYYEDPQYFAGGVVYISFAGNRPQDPKMWREVGVQHADGSFTGVREPDYQGATTAGDTVYFEPNVRKRIEWEEVPTADYRPSDTFDHIYSRRPPMSKTDEQGVTHWFVQVCHFLYDEAPGHSGSRPDGLRTASRTVRRAIKAEVRRTQLPVMRVEPLLELLGAEWIAGDALSPTPAAKASDEENPSASGKSSGSEKASLPQAGHPADEQPDRRADGHGATVNLTRSPVSTPTFFAFEHHYFIGCDYPCKAEGLIEISPQTHRTYQCKAERLEKQSVS